jgi:hypothetical protein
MFRILAPAVVIASVAAFTAQTQPVARALQTVNAAPVMAWHLSTEGRMAKLAYGVANTDDLAMMVTCSPGNEAADVYGDVTPINARPSKDSPFGDAKVSLTDTGLSDLVDKGAIRVSGEAGAFNLRATAQERRAIGQFLSYCRGKQP